MKTIRQMALIGSGAALLSGAVFGCGIFLYLRSAEGIGAGASAVVSVIVGVCVLAAVFSGILCLAIYRIEMSYWRLRPLMPVRFGVVSRTGELLTQCVESGLPGRHDLKYFHELPERYFSKMKKPVDETFRTQKERTLDYEVDNGVRHAIFKYLPREIFGQEAVFWSSWDVTELNSARRRLEESRDLLQQIFDNVPAGLMLKDPDDDFRYTVWNPQLGKDTGIPMSEVIGKTDFELNLFPGKAESFRSQDELVMRQNGPLTITEEMLRRNGTAIVYRTTKLPLRLSSGKQYLLGLMMDVTEQNRLIRDRDELYDQLNGWLQNSSIVNTCLHNLMLSNNFDEFAMDILGACGKGLGDHCTIFKLIDDDTRVEVEYDWASSSYTAFPSRRNAFVFDKTFPGWRGRMLRNQDVLINDVDVQPPDLNGSSDIMKAVGAKSLAASGIWYGKTLYGFLLVSRMGRKQTFTASETGLIHDISRLYTLSMERREQRTEVGKAREAKDDIFRNDRVLNQCLETLMRRGNFETAIQKTLDILCVHFHADYTYIIKFKPEKSAAEILYERYASGRIPLAKEMPSVPLDMDSEWFLRDTLELYDAASEESLKSLGGWQPLVEKYHLRSVYVCNMRILGRKWGAIGVVYAENQAKMSENDLRLLHTVSSFMEVVWERQFINEQFRLSRDAALSAEKAKSSFLATMSHEIRTPLNSVIGFAELLQNGDVPASECREYLKSIFYAGNTLLSLINDVLDLSKIEADRMQILPEKTNLGELMNELLAVFRQRAKENNIIFTVDFPPDLPWITIDPQRVRQILFNLIGNAIKFAPLGRVTASASFTKDEEGGAAPSGTLVITISDNGSGIPLEMQEKVFQPFMQVRETEARSHARQKGTGLGLPISKKLAEKMGGTLTLTSAPGEGSCFRFTLPHVPYLLHKPGEQSTAVSPFDGGYRKDARVLLVDDVPANLIVLKKMLERFGIRSETANTGEEALKLAAGTPFDIVMSDVWMPGLNGMQLAAVLRKQAGARKIRIIAVTADIDFTKNREAANFDGCILKPITLINLRKLLCQLVPIDPPDGAASGA